jgi:hypothetical protein
MNVNQIELGNQSFFNELTDFPTNRFTVKQIMEFTNQLAAIVNLLKIGEEDAAEALGEDAINLAAMTDKFMIGTEDVNVVLVGGKFHITHHRDIHKNCKRKMK